MNITLARSNKIVLALAAIWTVAFAVHTGCESTPGLNGTTEIDGGTRPEIIIDAPLAKDPMIVQPDAMSRRTNYVDVTDQIPSDATFAQFNLDLGDITVELPDDGTVRILDVDLLITESANGPLSRFVKVASFSYDVDGAGSITIYNTDQPVSDYDVVSLLRDGEFGLEVRVRGDFEGMVTIDRAQIGVGFGTARPRWRDRMGNDNDNTRGNMNDNTRDNQNDNTSGNRNDNTGDNANDNTGDNTNDNTGGNTNDNTGDNTNDNTPDNANDNTAGGVCADGSIQLRTRIEGPGDFEVEVDYRAVGESCRRFRVEVNGFPAGEHDVFANDVLVGQIVADMADGRGELRLETDDGNFPADFPDLSEGDVVSVGDVIDVTLEAHCSEIFMCDNMNGNDNTGNTNGNDNTGNTNANDNTPDNTNANV